MTTKLLVVDDDPDVRMLMKIIFQKQSIEVFSAANGDEAVKLAKQQRPDMVLLDIDLPGMDGLDVLKSIREFDKSIPVVMLTGNRDIERARQAKNLGATDYVTKPLETDYLRELVKKGRGFYDD